MNHKKNKNREQIKNKMSQALTEHINTLSTEMQDILLDDLVTAFESRFEVLNNAQLNVYCFANIGEKVTNAQIKAWNVHRPASGIES